MGTIPDHAHGYGNADNRYVFGINVQYALSSLVKYEAFDNNSTFPATGSLTTATNTVLAGTAGATNSMVALVDTSNGTPGASWVPGSATGGEANPNLLEGTTSYVEQDGSAASGNAGSYTTDPEITFNMCIVVPSDATTSSSMGFDLRVTYTYTGSDPNPKWQFNAQTTGTQATRDWTDITVDTHGIRHCRSGSGGANGYYANIPSSSTEETAEGWVTT